MCRPSNFSSWSSRRWQAKTGCDYINLMLTGDGGFEAHKRVIEMFGKEVIPNLGD